MAVDTVRGWDSAAAHALADGVEGVHRRLTDLEARANAESFVVEDGAGGASVRDLWDALADPYEGEAHNSANSADLKGSAQELVADQAYQANLYGNAKPFQVTGSTRPEIRSGTIDVTGGNFNVTYLLSKGPRRLGVGAFHFQHRGLRCLPGRAPSQLENEDRG